MCGRNCCWLFCRPRLLTGNHCRDFLLHDLTKLLEVVPLADRARMWNMHDGAPAHFSRAVRDVLSNTCHDRWIGRGGTTAWTPRSTPDLNPLDFYLWRHLKFLVFATHVDNEDALRHGIVDACQTIRNYPASLKGCGRPWRQLSNRALNFM
jgi:hypothetical protein